MTIPQLVFLCMFIFIMFVICTKVIMRNILLMANYLNDMSKIIDKFITVLENSRIDKGK